MSKDLSILERLEKVETDQQKTIQILEKMVRIVSDWKQKKTIWVKVSEVKKLTGWSKERLRRARINQEIEWKKKNGMWYNINSLHPLLIKQTA